MAGPGEAVFDWIDGAAKAARRARRDPGDAVALHRFRVNVRRLIVYAKAVGGPSGVPAKLRKRLRRALRATGPRRDAQVEARWLADFLRHQDQSAAAWARALLRRDGAVPAGLRAGLQVDKTLTKLRRAVKDEGAKPRVLREAQNEAAQEAWARLARRLRRLENDRGVAAVHKARIAVKRLRYLLETSARPPRGLPAPAALRALQAVLGDAHDRDVIAARIATGKRAETAATAVPAALSQLARERRALLSRAERRWKPLLSVRKSSRQATAAVSRRMPITSSSETSGKLL
jgi:CHAD domain-containing protein